MRRFWVILLIGALLPGCGGDAGPPDEPPAPAAAAGGSPELAIVRDVTYHTDTDLEWLPPLLDVYAPIGREGLPVVVMFHGGTGDIGKSYLAGLARATAEQGAVVFVPNYGTTAAEWAVPEADASAAVAERELDAAGCAIAFAVATAADHGGDPQQLILFGHSAGGQSGFTAGLRGPRDLPACVVEPVPFEVDGLVAYEGDWLMMGGPQPDELWGDELPKVLSAVTPWDWLEGDNRPNVDLVVSAGGRQQLQRELPDHTGDWLARRDPDGQHTQRLQALGALDDDRVDVGELSELLAATMRELDYDVEQLLLPDSGHEYSSVTDADRATLIEAILTVANRDSRAEQ
jgi:pimeloyl-ACP methyl ester carboxylesterase